MPDLRSLDYPSSSRSHTSDKFSSLSDLCPIYGAGGRFEGEGLQLGDGKMTFGDKKRQIRKSRRARGCRQNPQFPANFSLKDQRSNWGLDEDQSTKEQRESIPCGISRLQKVEATDSLLKWSAGRRRLPFKRCSNIFCRQLIEIGRSHRQEKRIKKKGIALLQ